MWSIRILSGKDAGKILPLNEGNNLVGRTEESNVTIASGGVSKRHAQISINNGQVEVSDLGSSNGTFVNGVQVRSKVIRPGDKISFYDVVVEVINAQAAQPQIHQGQPHHHDAQAQHHHDAALNEQQYNDGLKGRIEKYFDEVVLPGVYKLPEWFEFKWVLGMFVMAFILFVTSLSAVPMMRILKDSIETESQNRAVTIAKTLAKVNQRAISSGVESSITVKDAVSEPGVDQAYIISSADGRIIAPAREAGQFLTIKYANEGRKLDRGSVSQIDGSTIIAMESIHVFNAQTNMNSVSAFSVVVYNMGALAIEGGRTLSLFIQTFFIALIIGGILFFFLYKMIDHPLRDLNIQIDESLRSGSASIEVLYQYPSLKKLATNINSALNRALSSRGDMDGGMAPERDRFNEMTNIVNVIGYAALAVHSADNNIVAANNAFFDRTGLQTYDVLNANVDSLLDQALKLSIQDLLSRVQQDPDQLATNDLEFSGENFQITAQAVFGNSDISYVVVVLLPLIEQEALPA